MQTRGMDEQHFQAVACNRPESHASADVGAACCWCACRSGRIDREELKVLLESVEGGLAYPLMVAEVRFAVSHLQLKLPWRLVNELSYMQATGRGVVLRITYA
jgi:hypothetical protein